MKLRARSRLGKYRILKHRDSGGQAEVYEALDTLEYVRVALKIPTDAPPGTDMYDAYVREIRLNARLDHPHILAIKNAEVIGDRLVIAYALGDESLGDRLRRRIAVRTALDIGHQMLQALAHAHAQRVMHCDVKPENLILFPGHVTRLCDFGLARIAQRTVRGSGSGTLGYMAPEHAMGRPSFRSDVFAAALVIYRMLAGKLPEWPFEWPLPGSERLRRNVPPAFREFLKRGLHVRSRLRYAHAGTMLAAYEALLPEVDRYIEAKKKRRRGIR